MPVLAKGLRFCCRWLVRTHKLSHRKQMGKHVVGKFTQDLNVKHGTYLRGALNVLKILGVCHNPWLQSLCLLLAKEQTWGQLPRWTNLVVSEYLGAAHSSVCASLCDAAPHSERWMPERWCLYPAMQEQCGEMGETTAFPDKQHSKLFSLNLFLSWSGGETAKQHWAHESTSFPSSFRDGTAHITICCRLGNKTVIPYLSHNLLIKN